MVPRVHLECPDPREELDLWVEETRLWRTWGPIGGAHQTQSEDYPTQPLAEAALERQVRRLLGRYRLGVRDEGLERTLRERPDEVAGYLVYADWLLERGDPRGRLIADMAAGRVSDVAHLSLPERVQLAPSSWRNLKLACQWRWGFVQHVVMGACEWGLLARLLGHASLLVVQTLTLTHPGDWQLMPHDGWFAGLGARPPTLRAVRVPKRLGRALWAEQVPGLGFLEPSE